jgi:hypothetical protein
VTRAILGAVLLAATTAAAGPAARPVTIDIEDDGGLGDQLTGPPPDVVRPSLMKDRYRGIPDPASGEPIDDPLAVRAAPPARPFWLGARLGAGLFDDGSAAATAGLAVGVAARYGLGGRAFLAARADWSRRGGDAMARVGVIGASAGAGVAIARGVAVIGQLRGDVRLADHRDDRAVPRAGLGIAGEVELALPGSPITLGVRVEQGVTELVAGARDRAVLAELGVDLR